MGEDEYKQFIINELTKKNLSTQGTFRVLQRRYEEALINDEPEQVPNLQSVNNEIALEEDSLFNADLNFDEHFPVDNQPMVITHVSGNSSESEEESKKKKILLRVHLIKKVLMILLTNIRQVVMILLLLFPMKLQIIMGQESCTLGIFLLN